MYNNCNLFYIYHVYLKIKYQKWHLSTDGLFRLGSTVEHRDDSAIWNLKPQWSSVKYKWKDIVANLTFCIGK